MRDIDAVALAQLNQQFALQSILLLRVWWNDQYAEYSDKDGILDISGLDDVLSIDSSSTSTSVTVTLDDSLGGLRGVLNNVDIHKRKVQVLQWFQDTPKENAFVLFTGQINSPITWSEGNRTLTFTVLNMIENIEMGFSLDEGLIQQIPATAYGKAFPLVFGHVLKVPALKLSEQPAGITAEGFAYIFPKVYQAQINDISAQLTKASQIASNLYSKGLQEEIIASTYNNGTASGDGYSGFDEEGITGVGGATLTPYGNIYGDPVDDYESYKSHHDAAQQYFQQSAEYSQQVTQFQEEIIAINKDLALKQRYAIKNIPIVSNNFPRGVPVVVDINGTWFQAQFDGIMMTLGNYVPQTNLKPGQRYLAQIYDRTVVEQYVSTLADTKFLWFDAGTEIKVISVPSYYVACFGTESTIEGIYARRKGVRILVPANYYLIEHMTFTNERGNTVGATVIRFTQPLSTIRDAGGEQMYDSEEVWCDIQSDVPDQFVHIMYWILGTFAPTLIPDPTSFDQVYKATQNAPMNFAVLDRRNILDFIKDLCYQARVAVWVDDSVVRMMYLPAQPTPVDEITPDDIVEDSLNLVTNETESLITKYTATWKATMDQENASKIIVRQNIAKYGLHEDSFDFFAYNTHELVQRTAIFWLIRNGNTWKKVQFKCGMHKLKLESHDAVLLKNFNGLFWNGDVTGIVESAVYNPDDNSIDMTVWTPVRLGEMDPYKFAWTASVTDLWGDPNVVDYRTGNPFEGVQDTNGLTAMVNGTFVSQPYAPPYASSYNTRIDDQPPTFQVTTALSNVKVNQVTPAGIDDANDQNKYQVKDPTPITVTTTPPSVDFGYVVRQVQGNQYLVVLVGGTTVVTATQGLISADSVLPKNYPVYLVNKKGKYYMQAPVWAAEPQTDSDSSSTGGTDTTPTDTDTDITGGEDTIDDTGNFDDVDNDDTGYVEDTEGNTTFSGPGSDSEEESDE